MKIFLALLCLGVSGVVGKASPCSGVRKAFCLLESGDVSAAINQTCKVVSDAWPPAKIVCKRLDSAGADASSLAQEILDELRIAFSCPSFSCDDQNSRLVRKGSRPAIFESQAQICQGKESKLCCQLCMQVMSIAEKVVTDKHNEALAKKELQELCVKLESQPLQRAMCKVMVVEAVDQLWQYIEVDMEPQLACQKMHACPS